MNLTKKLQCTSKALYSWSVSNAQTTPEMRDKTAGFQTTIYTTNSRDSKPTHMQILCFQFQHHLICTKVYSREFGLYISTLTVCRTTNGGK